MAKDQDQEEAVYTVERRALAPSFAGKLDRIESQYSSFWSQAAAAPDVEAYRRATPGHAYAKEAANWVVGTTPFTDWRGPSFAASERALIIGNRSSFDVGQYRGNPARAGMSVVHLLAIPRAGIFNGVALDAENVSILDHMIGLFEASWARPEVRRAVLAHQKAAIERQHQAQASAPGGDDDRKEAYEAALAHYEELEGVVDSLGPGDFQYGLHLWPDHSVGHLHMHIIAAPYACRKYSTSRHDDKTKDAREVRDFVKNRTNIKI
ncbi:hypothetical protein F4778DRAFT_472265 [Xylariomycetidae sp. FL2044]|nr:hypothetical protein F4778DRAFT_472265 [Xylariomycetidae sp. FL2044]